ncbi:hypothetical protein C0J52_23028 [Blattella germanica]|nr:hypothetical protein C0J52_23028 [Blattella germanica]
MATNYSFGFIFQPRPVDFIGKLPILAATTLLRMLDSKSILAAAQVNKAWLSICRSDHVLRRKIRQQIASQMSLRLVSIRRQRKSFDLKDVFAPKSNIQDVRGANVAATSYIHVQTIKRRTKSPAPKKTTRSKPYEQRNKPRGKKSGPSIGMQMRML